MINGLADNLLDGTDVPQIKEDDRENLEMHLTEEDIIKALCTMKNNLAPGIDGITTSFLFSKPSYRLAESGSCSRSTVITAKKNSNHFDPQR